MVLIIIYLECNVNTRSEKKAFFFLISETETGKYHDGDSACFDVFHGFYRRFHVLRGEKMIAFIGIIAASGEKKLLRESDV